MDKKFTNYVIINHSFKNRSNAILYGGQNIKSENKM